MKPIESFVNMLAIYKDAECPGPNPAHGLSAVFVDAVAAALAPREYTVCSPGYETGAHQWSFSCRVTGFPGLSDGQAAVYGIDYTREDGTATAWAYVDDSGAQAEGSYTSGDSPEDPAATIEAAIAGLDESASKVRLPSSPHRTPGGTGESPDGPAYPPCNIGDQTMKTLDNFVSSIEIYNSLPENVQGDVHDLVPLFRTHLAAVLRDCKVDNPGFYGDAHTWTFEADVSHPDLRGNESLVLGLEFDRETSTASTWAYVQKDGEQVEDTYGSLPRNTDPQASVLNAIREYRDILEKSQKTPGDCARLQVTSVQVYPFKDGPSMGHMRALASVVLNDQFLVRGLRVMEGENGLFVGYPVDPFFKGEEFRSVCFPMARALREHIESTVLERYNELK